MYDSLKVVDKILFLYTDASRADTTDFSIKRRKKLRRLRVPNVSSLAFEKTMYSSEHSRSPLLNLMVKSPPLPKNSGTSGGMTERLKVHVLKTCLVKANVGSNPTPSAEGCMIKCPNV